MVDAPVPDFSPQVHCNLNPGFFNFHFIYLFFAFWTKGAHFELKNYDTKDPISIVC